MKVAKWGNSLAVRLPAELVEKLKLSEGDEIDFVALEQGVGVVRVPDRLELLAAFREKYRGIRPKDYKFDREEANARKRSSKSE